MAALALYSWRNLHVAIVAPIRPASLPLASWPAAT
jgi:hypothetical protein